MLRFRIGFCTNELCILWIVSEARGERPGPSAGIDQPEASRDALRPRRAVPIFNVVCKSCVSPNGARDVLSRSQEEHASHPATAPPEGRQVSLRCLVMATRMLYHSCVSVVVTSVLLLLANMLCFRRAFSVRMRLLTLFIHVLICV